MGMALLIESDPPLECPQAFPDTDSKYFLGTMFGPRVEVLERRLKLDLAPLKHCATDTGEGSEAMIREDWGEEAGAMIAEAKRSSELAWHPPEAFIACLEQLAARLEESGRKLPAAVYRAVDPSGHDRGYYQSGSFFSDVSGCLAAIRRLKEQGARRVRFFAF
jgi:hypothetical protein